MIVIVDVALVFPESDIDAGLNVALPPLGRPVAVRVTEPVNPLGVTVISVELEVPFDMLKLEGLALKLILPVGGGAALTTNVTDVV